MSIVWMDGFDNYGTDNPVSTRWIVTSSGVQYGTAGRFDGLCLQGGFTIQHPLPLPEAAVAVGAAFKVHGYPGIPEPLLAFVDSTNTYCTLFLSSAGDLVFVRGNNVASNVLATATGVIALDAWAYIEVEFTSDPSAGAVDIYLNGASVASATGANTGSAHPTAVAVTAPSSNVFVDDYYCVNVATRLGECRFQTIAPNADTAQKDFTPASGSDNYVMVDALPITGTSDYVSDSTSGKSDLYATGGLSGSVGTILAVQTIVTAKKDDTGFRSITPRLVSGSTDATAVASALSASYSQSVTLAEVDPATSAAWTKTAVNAATIGMETGS